MKNDGRECFGSDQKQFSTIGSMGLVYLPTFGSHHNIDGTSKPLSSLLTNQDFYPNVGVEIIVRLTLGDFLLPRVGLNVTQ